MVKCGILYKIFALLNKREKNLELDIFVKKSVESEHMEKPHQPRDLINRGALPPTIP